MLTDKEEKELDKLSSVNDYIINGDVVYLKLTHGYCTILDYDSFLKVKDIKWWSHITNRKNVYAVAKIYINGIRKEIRMHRYILDLTDTNFVVDHIDHDGLNNLKSNLRICTNHENITHTSKRIGSNSKYLGVHYRKQNCKYAAQIQFNKVKRMLGYFLDEKEAAIHYNIAAIRKFKSFANLNVI